MSREERRALFPPDRSGAESRLFPPYRVDGSEIPSTGGMLRLTPGEWIARAQALLDAGLREQFLAHLSSVLANHSDLAVEAAQFAGDVVTASDREAMDLWYFLRREEVVLEYLDEYDPAGASVRRARWARPPGTAEHEAAFARALQEGQWPAIRAAGLLIRWGIEVPVDAETAELAEIWWTLATFPHHGKLIGLSPPTEAELERLGAHLARDAERSPYLLPVLHACNSHCPDSTARCMAIGAVSLKGSSTRAPSALEAVLPAAACYASDRAARHALARIGLMVRNFGSRLDGLHVPPCLREAAESAANAAFPQER